MNHGLMPYIGGKHRVAKKLAGYLQATGADTMVDVFGGSGAVIIASGFVKRIYNDRDGDLVHLFRVLADPLQRKAFLDRLLWTPPSRQLFEDWYTTYRNNGFSFAGLSDPIEHAVAVFYRHHFSFGGKTRSGGFSVSDLDCYQIKEVGRFNNAMRRVERIGEFYRHTLIENLHYQELITTHGDRQGVVLFCDPPYVGTEKYYSVSFTRQDHVFLAHLLNNSPAKVVCTYYDDPLVRDLYPANKWEWNSIQATKNSQFSGKQKECTNEMVLVKKA